jgi:hypothetical protein
VSSPIALSKIFEYKRQTEPDGLLKTIYTVTIMTSPRGTQNVTFHLDGRLKNLSVE